MGEALVQFHDVDLGYGGKAILSGLNFTIEAGDFFALVGPNGSGKTTIVKAILGAIAPMRGKIILSPDADGRKPRFGYVPQREQLDLMIPLTAAEVVMMGRYKQIGLARRPSRHDREKALEALTRMGIPGAADVPLQELSGGQVQRALIARAIVGDARFLALDEPTRGMDLFGQRSIMEQLKHLHQTGGLTIVLVTHLLNEVANYATKIALVEKDFFFTGPTHQVLTEENLESLYKIKARVTTVFGQIIVIPGVTDD